MSKKIALENILTIGAREYCEMVGKPLSFYMPVGVKGGIFDCLFAPEDTEVVVSYRSIRYDGVEGVGIGTALVRKKDKL